MFLSRQRAIPAAQQFHNRFSARKFDDIYADATGSFFRSRKDREGFEHLRDLLGAVKSSQLGLLSENVSTHGSFVTATFATVYDRGTATELFRWFEGTSLTLVEYHARGLPVAPHITMGSGNPSHIKPSAN